MATAVGYYNCPTRRKAVTYPFVNTANCFNYDPPAAVGRSDYAGCAGDGSDWPVWAIPSDLATGDLWTWNQWHGYGDSTTTSGVICRRSMIKMTDVSDGASNTYLAGEKYLDPDDYYDGIEDDQGWTVGYDFDVNRWTNTDDSHRPRQDQPGGDYFTAFGRRTPRASTWPFATARST